MNLPLIIHFVPDTKANKLKVMKEIERRLPKARWLISGRPTAKIPDFNAIRINESGLIFQSPISFYQSDSDYKNIPIITSKKFLNMKTKKATAGVYYPELLPSANKVVKTIKTQSGAKWEIYREGKQYGTRLISKNGKLICGNTGFNTVAIAMKNINSVGRNAPLPKEPTKAILKKIINAKTEAQARTAINNYLNCCK